MQQVEVIIGTYEDYVTSGNSLQNRRMQIDTQTHSRPVLPTTIATPLCGHLN